MCLDKGKANEGSPRIAHSLMRSPCPHTLTKRKWRTPSSPWENEQGNIPQELTLVEETAKLFGSDIIEIKD